MSNRFTLNNELKQNPFAVPDNYFEGFVVKKSIALNDELRQNPFAVPEGYFETLQEHIVERVVEAKVQPSLSRWQPLRAQLAFALSFVLLVAVGYGTFSLLFQPKTQDRVVHENYAEIAPAYLSNMVDEHTLLYAVANDSEPQASQEISDDDIIQYLANANVSINDIAALY